MPEQSPSYEQLLAENISLREENRILRQKLGLNIQVSTTVPKAASVNEINLFPKVSVTQASSSDEKIALFMSLFRGREDVYAKRWYSTKTEKSGYSPICLNEWEPGMCDKRKYKCNKCPNRKLATLGKNAIFQHLSGKSNVGADVVGLYPMTPDECCWFLAIDFDDEGWQKDVSAFRSVCSELGLEPAVERSRSGNGGHVWFFFEEKIPAAVARRFGSALLTKAMSLHHEIKFNSYDRLFPNQDIMPKGGFGNLIALPLQGLVRKNNNSLFIDEDFTPYPDQWAFLSSVSKLKAEAVDSYIRQLCGDSELGILSTAGSDDEQKPWESKIKHPELSPLDFTGAVKIVKANMLHINKTGISQNALNRIKRLGAFRNPDFYKAQAMRLPTYNKPRVIDTTEESAQYLSIPRGCEDDLSALLDSANAVYEIDDKRNPGNPIKADFNGVLRPEQKAAADTLLQYENGILSATTAFGKTVIGAHIISQKKVSTLILVHTSALLEQWKKSLSQFLTVDEPLPEQPQKRGRKKEASVIGQLGSTKNTLNGRIDIAIMQSLASGDEVKELVKDYGMVIVDECHHVSAVSFEKILKTVNAKHVYGLTATPTRQDGQHPIIFMQCGAIRYQVDAKKQAEKAGFERFVVPRFTSFKKPIGIDDKDFGITAIYSAIAENEPRNRMIIADVAGALEKGRTPIVLAQRSAHVTCLADALDKSCPNVIRLMGKKSAKEKREDLERLRSIPKDERFVIVATGKYVGEGFDEPRLDTLFLAAPISWKGTLQQYAGRLHRAYEGKENVIVYDYVDVHIKMLENMYHKRVSGYSGMGYKALNEDRTDEKIDIIFDNHSFLPAFEKDILSAKHEIVICSPYLRKGRTMLMIKTLSPAKINGVRITVITRSAESCKLTDQPGMIALMQSLIDSGITVIQKPNIHQKFAVVDQSIVWYGSINLLGYGAAEESVMRLENAEIAGELLAAVDE